MASRHGNARLDVIAGVSALVLVLAVLIPGVERARESARRTVSKGHLKKWALAIYNYEDVYDRLPAGGWILDDGTERHGWVTALLPYLDSSPLFDSFDLHKPWHHPRNQPICRWSLPLALYPNDRRSETAEGYGLCHYAVNPSLMHRNSSLRLDEIATGLANTLLAGEALGDFRPWACPWNWRPIESPLNQDAGGYGHAGRDSTYFAIADGQVRLINNDIDPVALRQLAFGGVVNPEEGIARPPIPPAYPSTKIRHRFDPPRKSKAWSPPPEWEKPETD